MGARAKETKKLELGSACRYPETYWTGWDRGERRSFEIIGLAKRWCLYRHIVGLAKGLVMAMKGEEGEGEGGRGGGEGVLWRARQIFFGDAVPYFNGP